MDPSVGGAVTLPTISRTSSSAAANVIINANHQSNSSSSSIHHQQQHHTPLTHTNSNNNSSGSSSSTGSSSNNSNNSLLISVNGGNGGSSNSSSSSSSTSSNSSGYGGSTSATPTNSYETHTAATTPVAVAEPIIPIATVAAVSPYYSEAIATQALETQHYTQQHQQHPQHHLQQQHQQQQTQQHLQEQHQPLQHNLQDNQRQQYYSTYDYTQQQQPLQLHHQQQQLPQQQQQHQQAHNLSSTYNMGSDSPAYDGASTTNTTAGVAYQQGAVPHQYKPTALTAATGVNYERQLSGRSASSAVPPVNYQQHLQNESTNPKPLALSHHHQQFLGVSGSSSSVKSRSSNSLLGPSSSSSSSTSTKPQAAATPFYAQPLSHQQQSNNTSSFYDQLKHKMPLDYHDNFANFPNAAAYHQQQKYYAAAKSQLKEAASYGTPPGLTSKSLYHNTSNYYAGASAQQHAGSLPTTGYDKYMYPSLGYETSPETAYRKASAASSLNSASWPWGIDYASGNSRTIPPPTTTGHLPTATVAPTHASYLAANTSHLARDPYYMTHDKYGMKYDKYSPAYQQAYVSPPATRHHLWPGTHAPLNERLAPPPPHALHSASPYFPSNPPSALNARQSCCAQPPYQPQSCYYPPGRLTHGQPSAPMGQSSSAYMTSQSTAHHQSHLSALNSSCKYGTVMDYGTAGSKLKTANDLYLSSHYDANNPPPPHLTHPHNYQYGSAAAAAAAANNQLYSSNQMHHGQQPARPLITHDPLANTATYTNDLSLSANSTYDTYLHEPPSHLNHHPQNLGISSGPTMATYAPSAAKRALLDYRKPIQPQPPPVQPSVSVSVENFAQHHTPQSTQERYHQSPELLNTPETTTAFNEYDSQSQASGYAPDDNQEILEERISKPGEEANKNLSLRDFIANWNDDEDDYAAANAAASTAENLSFDQSTVINEVLKASNVEPQLSIDQPPPPLIPDKVRVVENLSKVPPMAKPFVDSPLSEADAANQYINLPDIIIDIEKSNVNSSISTPPPNSDQAGYSNSLSLDNFDVEKELDQLQQMRKGENDSVIVKPIHHGGDDIANPTKETKNDIKPKANADHTTSRDSDQTHNSKSLTTQISFDDLNLESNKAVLPARPLTTANTTDAVNSQPTHPGTLAEQSIKDMEAYDSGNSHHSNESSLFEKEYETFINKITNNSESVTKPETESVTDFEQNVQDFSKFYKRKRKLKDEEVMSPHQTPQEVEQYTKKLKSAEEENVKNSNFPQVYTKKSRNRQRVPQVKRLNPDLQRRRKPSSSYYRLMHSLRRYRLRRSKRVRDYIAELKEKHLPLIKRQSIKNYSIAMNATTNCFSPLTLKNLVLSVINSEEFRERIMVVELMEEAPETEEKHICLDPSCETCEVIRSLMEPESYEEAVVLDTAQGYDNEIVDLSTYEPREISDLVIESNVILAAAEVMGYPPVLAETGESEQQQLEPILEIKDSIDSKLASDLQNQLEYEVLNLKNVKPVAGVIIKTGNRLNPGNVSADEPHLTEVTPVSDPESQLSTVRSDTKEFPTHLEETRIESKAPANLPEPAALTTTVIRQHATERDEDYEPKKKYNVLDYHREATLLPSTTPNRTQEVNELSVPQTDHDHSKIPTHSVQTSSVIRKIICKTKKIEGDAENKESKQVKDVDEVQNFSKNFEKTATTFQNSKTKLSEDLRGVEVNDLSNPQTTPQLKAQATTVIRKHESKPKEVLEERLRVSKPLSSIFKSQPKEAVADEASESDTGSSSSGSSSDSSDDEDKGTDDSQDSSESESEIENETIKDLIKEVQICEKLSRGSTKAQDYDRISVISGSNEHSNQDCHKEANELDRKDLSKTLAGVEGESKTKEILVVKSPNKIQMKKSKEDDLELKVLEANVVKTAVGIKRCLMQAKLVKNVTLSSSDSSDESEDDIVLSDGEQENERQRKTLRHWKSPNKKSKLLEGHENPTYPRSPLISAEDLPADYPENKNTGTTEEILENYERSESYHTSDYSHAIPKTDVRDMDKLFPHSPIRILSDDEELGKLSPGNPVTNMSDDEDLTHHHKPSLSTRDLLFPHSPKKVADDEGDLEKLSAAASPVHNASDVGDLEEHSPKKLANNTTENEGMEKSSPPSPANYSNSSTTPSSDEDDQSVSPPKISGNLLQTKENWPEDTKKEEIIDISDTSSSEDSEQDDSDNESLDGEQNKEQSKADVSMEEVTQIVDITEDSTSEEEDDFDDENDTENEICSEISKPQSLKYLKELSEDSRSSSLDTNSDDSEPEDEEEETPKVTEIPPAETIEIPQLSVESNEENRELEKDTVEVPQKQQTSTENSNLEDSRNSLRKNLETTVIKSVTDIEKKDQSEPILSDEENSLTSTDSIQCGLQTKTSDRSPAEDEETSKENTKFSTISPSIIEDPKVLQTEEFLEKFRIEDHPDAVISEDGEPKASKNSTENIIEVETNKIVRDGEKDESIPEEDKNESHMSDSEESKSSFGSKEDCIGTKIQDNKISEECSVTNIDQIPTECEYSLNRAKESDINATASVVESNKSKESEFNTTASVVESNANEIKDISEDGEDPLRSDDSETTVPYHDNVDSQPKVENSKKCPEGHADANSNTSIETSEQSNVQTPNNQANLEESDSYHNKEDELKKSPVKYREVSSDDLSDEVLDISNDSKIFECNEDEKLELDKPQQAVAALEEKAHSSQSIVESMQMGDNESYESLNLCQTTPPVLVLACENSSVMTHNEEIESDSPLSPTIEEPPVGSETSKEPCESLEESSTQSSVKQDKVDEEAMPKELYQTLKVNSPQGQMESGESIPNLSPLPKDASEYIENVCTQSPVNQESDKKEVSESLKRIYPQAQMEDEEPTLSKLRKESYESSEGSFTQSPGNQESNEKLDEEPMPMEKDASESLEINSPQAQQETEEPNLLELPTESLEESSATSPASQQSNENVHEDKEISETIDTTSPKSPTTEESTEIEDEGCMPKTPIESSTATTPKSPTIERPTQIENEEFMAKVVTEDLFEPSTDISPKSTQMDEEECLEKISATTQEPNESLVFTSSISPAIEEPTQKNEEECLPKMTETPKEPNESLGYTSPKSPAIVESTLLDDKESLSKNSETLKEPSESLGSTSPKSPAIVESTLLDDKESMSKKSETLKEPSDSLRSTSPKSPAIAESILLDDKESMSKKSQTLKEPSDSLGSTSPKSPANVESTPLNDKESMSKMSEIRKESLDEFPSQSLTDEMVDELSVTKVVETRNEPREVKSPQLSAITEEPMHTNDEETFSKAPETPKENCETNSPQYPIIKELNQTNDEESLIKVSVTLEQSSQTLNTTSPQSPAITESAHVEEEPHLLTVPKEPYESSDKTSPQSPAPKESTQSEDDQSLLNSTEASNESYESSFTTSKPSPIIEIPKSPQESSDMASPQSPAFEESTQTNEVQSMLNSTEKCKESYESSFTSKQSPITETPKSPHEFLEQNSPQSSVREETNDSNCEKSRTSQTPSIEEPTMPHISESLLGKDQKTIEEHSTGTVEPIENESEHSNDKFQTSHISSETSRDSCSYSSKSPISFEDETSENCNSSDLSHPLTRSLHREASPEMNFWNTKGKYHTLRNYKSLASKSPIHLRTRTALSGSPSSSGKLEEVKSAEHLRNQSAVSGDFSTADSVTKTTEDTTSLQNSTLDDLKLSSPITKDNTNTTMDKTNEDLSTDFLGFKNQSSFDDVSEDFHGFEDQHEEDRIRREIENLNEDSAANDAFPYATTNLPIKSPTRHSDSTSSELDELEALEKELSQHRLVKDLGVDAEALNEEDETELETEPHLVSVSNVIISTNDIEHIKKMLESDEEPANDESDVVIKAKGKKSQSEVELRANVEEDIRATNICRIPKLSDLCRAALNSSLIVNSLTNVQSKREEKVDEAEEETNTTRNPFSKTPTTISLHTCSAPSIVVERELSVEEAFAEMYRQAGVLLSDPEDNDSDKTLTTRTTAATRATTTASTNEEAQDVLLINLHEILNSDNDNVYVLQCDMNVNGDDDDGHDDNDIASNGAGANENSGTERVNTLQLIGILNTDSENPEIHIISSDSESEVIILSDCDTDVEFQTPALPPPSVMKRSTPPRDYIPFINDMDTSNDSLSDLSTIHHEEIVPDNLHKFLQEEFYKYLHEKYAQKKLSKYYHANRVLRKYKKKVSHKYRQ